MHNIREDLQLTDRSTSSPTYQLEIVVVNVMHYNIREEIQLSDITNYYSPTSQQVTAVVMHHRISHIEDIGTADS